MPMSRLAKVLEDTRKERNEIRINERFMMITYGIVGSIHYLENLEYLDDLELLESLDLLIQ